MTAQAVVKKTSAAVKPTAKKSPVVVHLRRSSGGGGVPSGHFVLIVNPKVFGSTGTNWLGGKSYADKAAALAAARSAGATVANL